MAGGQAIKDVSAMAPITACGLLLVLAGCADKHAVPRNFGKPPPRAEGPVLAGRYAVHGDAASFASLKIREDLLPEYGLPPDASLTATWDFSAPSLRYTLASLAKIFEVLVAVDAVPRPEAMPDLGYNGALSVRVTARNHQSDCRLSGAFEMDCWGSARVQLQASFVDFAGQILIEKAIGRGHAEDTVSTLFGSERETQDKQREIAITTAIRKAVDSLVEGLARRLHVGIDAALPRRLVGPARAATAAGPQNRTDTGRNSPRKGPSAL